MKQFFTVLRFELLSMIRAKSYVISTVIISLIIVIGLNVPNIINVFNGDNDKKEDGIGDVFSDEKATYAVYDEKGVMNAKDLKAYFPNTKLLQAKDTSDMKKLVEDEKADAGFEITSATSYDYYVKNTSMYDSNTQLFDQVMTQNYRLSQFREMNVDGNKVNQILSTTITHEEKVLGKDGVKNYAYTYVLIMVIYMMIIMHGQQISMNVASEKSNRSIEILVTSVDSNALIFGKVIAGALAGICQVAFLLAVGGITYSMTAASWGNALDMLFHIPPQVLLSFAAFGIVGYFFYIFIYGALGALVSRTEDIGSAATPITIIFVIVFFVTFMGMNDMGGSMVKIASFIPFSSFMAMFVRISMGSVTLIEILISFVILLASTILVGFGAAKIYRKGTLMYGNTIKFKNALKFLKHKD